MEKRIIEIYAEKTPNPNSLKFVTNRLLNASMPVEYNALSDNIDSPLAKKLFTFPYVKSVFISGNYLTITKANELDWYELMTELRDFIKKYLEDDLPIFSDYRNNLTVNDTTNTSTINFNNEIEAKIFNVLEEYIRPAVEQDGGAIEFKSFKDGVVTVILKGSCSGCPSSTLTLKAGIEGLLKRMVPEVMQVVAEND
jgi:Fe-S cluster biogenesis protein NfuA